MGMINHLIGKKQRLYILASLLLITMSGCGTLEEEAATTVLTDNFSSYSSFPKTPWSVVLGNDSGWTIVTSGDDYAARFYPSSADSSYLLNANFSSSGDLSVTGNMKIVSASATTGKYGLYLRASDGLNSYYELIFDTVNDKVYIYNISGSVSLLGSVSFTVSSYMTDYHNYKFALSGSAGDTLTLKAYVDDTLILTATDSAPLVNNFKTGFFFTGVSDGYITSYQITQP